MNENADSPPLNDKDCGEPLGHELRITDLSVRYGEISALEGVNLHTRCGTCLGLIGPNGAGKSTLMKAMAGLVRPAGGRIDWRGAPLAKATSEIAYLAQREEVDWNFPLTVRGLVEMGRFPHVGWWRRFGKRDQEVVEAAIETMRLGDLANRQISALSGGQQQRAFVARALAQEAHILLLDEPFTGLDRPSQELLMELLAQLAAGGRLVIASHHDLDTVEEIFDEVLFLNRCQVDFGTVADVFHTRNLEACFGRIHLYNPTSDERQPSPSGDEVVTS